MEYWKALQVIAMTSLSHINLSHVNVGTVLEIVERSLPCIAGEMLWPLLGSSIRGKRCSLLDR